MDRILITGAAGGLGKLLRADLKGWAKVMRINDVADLGAAAPDEEIVQCDLGDLDAVTAMVDGVDGIIHLGGKSIEGTFEEILNSNLRGTYNIFEASRRHGGKRIMFASSNHAIGFHVREQSLDGTSAQRPDSIYGLSKCYGEDLARYYFDKFAVESVSVRIGSCFPEPKDRRMLATWLSPADFVRLMKCIFEADRVGVSMIYGVSNNRETWWDNSHAAFLGWQPQDTSEIYREKVETAHPKPHWDDPAVRYHGGMYAKVGHFEDP
ncbi:MAG: NAD(P)-dependent oxidoreductase [Pseudomonadota bacterium]